MANKPKSRVSTKNSNQLTQFKFRWWMALILVAVVAVIGIIIIRFSHASTAPRAWTAADSELVLQSGTGTVRATDQALPTANKTVFINPLARTGIKTQINFSLTDKVAGLTPNSGVQYCVWVKAPNTSSAMASKIVWINNQTTPSVTNHVPFDTGYATHVYNDNGYMVYCRSSKFTQGDYDAFASKGPTYYLGFVNETDGSALSVWKVERTIIPSMK